LFALVNGVGSFSSRKVSGDLGGGIKKMENVEDVMEMDVLRVMQEIEEVNIIQSRINSEAGEKKGRDV